MPPLSLIILGLEPEFELLVGHNEARSGAAGIRDDVKISEPPSARRMSPLKR